MSPSDVIAVDLGGTKLAAGLVHRDGAVVRRRVEPTDLASEIAVLGQLERITALPDRWSIVDGTPTPSAANPPSARLPMIPSS